MARLGTKYACTLVLTWYSGDLVSCSLPIVMASSWNILVIYRKFLTKRFPFLSIILSIFFHSTFVNYLLLYLLYLLYFTHGLHRSCNNICSISMAVTESHCHLNEVTHSSEAVFIVMHGKNNVQLQRTIYQCVVKRDNAAFGSRRVILTMKNMLILIRFFSFDFHENKT